MAVDAAESCIDRADAGRHEGDVPPFVTGGSEPLGNMSFKVERLLIMGSLFNADLIGESVDHQDDLAFALTGHLDGVKTGVFEKGAEVAAKVGNARDAGQGGKGDCHCLGSAGKLGDAAKGAVGEDQRVGRVSGDGVGSYGLMEKIETEAAPADEIVPHAGIEIGDGDSVVAKVDGQDPVCVAPVDGSFRIIH